MFALDNFDEPPHAMVVVAKADAKTLPDRERGMGVCAPVSLHSGKCAGDALYRKVISEAVEATVAARDVTNLAGCFVAGTLVHTKNGLIPIEKIRVGDWVWSQPAAKGELSCMQVVNTFQFDDKEVFLLYWTRKEAYDEAIKSGCPIKASEFHSLVVTGNHQFWVKGLGWTRADHLEYEHELELFDGQTGVVSCIDPVHRTGTQDLGWVQVASRDSEEGRLLDLREGQIGSNILGDVVSNEGIEWWEECIKLTPRVYNFEVESNHTYYVGKLGVWVHSTHCGAA